MTSEPLREPSSNAANAASNCETRCRAACVNASGLPRGLDCSARETCRTDSFPQQPCGSNGSGRLTSLRPAIPFSFWDFVRFARSMPQEHLCCGSCEGQMDGRSSRTTCGEGELVGGVHTLVAGVVQVYHRLQVLEEEEKGRKVGQEIERENQGEENARMTMHMDMM